MMTVSAAIANEPVGEGAALEDAVAELISLLAVDKGHQRANGADGKGSCPVNGSVTRSVEFGGSLEGSKYSAIPGWEGAKGWPQAPACKPSVRLPPSTSTIQA